MQEQSENKEHLKENNSIGSSDEDNENQNNETPSSSTSEVKPKAEDEVVTPSEIASLSSKKNQSEILIDEAPNSRAEHLAEKLETVKQKTFKLPAECKGGAPSSELEPVGDDCSKKNEVRILCECEPNVAGAAVPAVKSFTPTDNQNLIRCNKSNCNLPEDSCFDKSQQPGMVPLRNKDTTKQVSKIGQMIKDSQRERNCSNSTNRTFKCSPQSNQLSVEKQNLDSKGHPKKPSLIPKPTRPNTNNIKILDKEETEKGENVIHSPVKPDLQKHSPKSGVKIKETSSLHFSKSNITKATQSNVNTISSRMIGLQERLKATTSMLRQKIEMDRTKEKTSPEENRADLEGEQETNTDIPSSSKTTVEELYKNIYSLKDVASALSENNTLTGQTKYIEQLFKNISEIKLIADKLSTRDQLNSKQDLPNNASDTISVEKKKSSSTNTKDNKIYIKFMHSKERKCDNKKKIRELSPNQSEEVQNDPVLGSKLTSDSLNSDFCTTEKVSRKKSA